MDRRRSSTRVLIVATIAAAVLGCGDAGGVREGPTMAEGAQKSALLDDEAVKEMMSPDTVGRIIYEPPPDLSLESARQRRPDLVKPDTTRPQPRPRTP